MKKKSNPTAPNLGTPTGTEAVAGVIEQPIVAPAPKKGDKLTRGGTSSGRPGQIVTAANRWRENYNPLRGLTMRRVVELLELGQRGDYAYLQWCYRMVERRYATLAALITRCESPLLGFDWEIKIREDLPESSKAAAEAQATRLRAAYDQVDNMKEAIAHLHMAQFRGYSHLQKHRDEGGSIYHLEALHQWCICRDGLDGNWWWNPDSRSTSAPLQFLGKGFCIGGDALPIDDFIIADVPRPLDEIALVNFVRNNLCQKDWDGFIEIYGIPGGVVTMPPNVPQGKEIEYEQAAQKVAEGGSGAIPNGSTYEANDAPRGVDPFTPRLNRLDMELVLAATGGKLTMLAESGSGTLAGSAHQDTFDEIAEARAQAISEIFQDQFDREILGDEPALAYFELCGKAEIDVDSLVKNVVSLSTAGKTADVAWLSEKTGYQLTEAPDPAPDDLISATDALDKNGKQEKKGAGVSDTQPASPGFHKSPSVPVKNRAEGKLDVAGALKAAMGQDIGHILARLQAILKIQDDDMFAQKLTAFLDDFPQLQKDVLADAAAARAMQAVIEQGFLDGLMETKS